MGARIWIQRVTAIWHWIAACSFLAYVMVAKEPYPLARGLLTFVAAAEIVALVLESLCRRFDKVDVAALRKEIAINAEEGELLRDEHEEHKREIADKFRTLDDIRRGRDPYNSDD